MATLLKDVQGTDDLGPGAEFSSSVPLEPAPPRFRPPSLPTVTKPRRNTQGRRKWFEDEKVGNPI
jgi:hypothetical protein